MIVIHCECIQNEIQNTFKCGPDLLRDFKADVGAKSEHVLHLFRCSGDQWDVQCVIAVLQVLQMIVKFGLTRVSYAWRIKEFPDEKLITHTDMICKTENIK